MGNRKKIVSYLRLGSKKEAQEAQGCSNDSKALERIQTVHGNIFNIADVVCLVQKTVRRWLAQRYVEKLRILRGEERVYNAAVQIQKVWRRYQAQMNMLFTLVHIIIAQSSKVLFVLVLQS